MSLLWIAGPVFLGMGAVSLLVAWRIYIRQPPSALRFGRVTTWLGSAAAEITAGTVVLACKLVWQADLVMSFAMVGGLVIITTLHGRRDSIQRWAERYYVREWRNHPDYREDEDSYRACLQHPE